MPKLSFVCRYALAAAALSVAQPLLAQGTTGLGAKLDAAEKKLDEDIKACKQIDASEYSKLVQEADENYKRAVAAQKIGVPVDAQRLAADEDRAKALERRAYAAAANCPPQAQKPGQAPPPPKAPQPQAPGAAAGKPLDKFDEAQAKLDAEIKACRVRADDYKPLVDEAKRNLERGKKAQKTGAPVDVNKLQSDLERAQKIYDAAKAAEAKQGQNCPPKEESKAAPQQAAPPGENELLPGLEFDTPGTRKSKSASGNQQPAPQPNGKTALPLDPFALRILNVHNAERAAFGVPPLQWNTALAAAALDYARQLARTGQLVHAPREGRGIERENLNQGMLGWNTDQMLGNWLRERGNFIPGVYPNVARDGNWLNVSHYTQMIWPTTTDIGCGMAPGNGFKWLVCRYSPGGNKDGRPVGQAPQAAKTEPCPSGTKQSLLWSGGNVTITCTPVFFTTGRSAAKTSISVPPPTSSNATAVPQFKNGQASVSASVRTTAGESKVTSTVGRSSAAAEPHLSRELRDYLGELDRYKAAIKACDGVAAKASRDALAAAIDKQADLVDKLHEAKGSTFDSAIPGAEADLKRMQEDYRALQAESAGSTCK